MLSYCACSATCMTGVKLIDRIGGGEVDVDRAGRQIDRVRLMADVDLEMRAGPEDQIHSRDHCVAVIEAAAGHVGLQGEQPSVERAQPHIDIGPVVFPSGTGTVLGRKNGTGTFSNELTSRNVI